MNLWALQATLHFRGNWMLHFIRNGAGNGCCASQTSPWRMKMKSSWFPNSGAHGQRVSVYWRRTKRSEHSVLKRRPHPFNSFARVETEVVCLHIFEKWEKNDRTTSSHVSMSSVLTALFAPYLNIHTLTHMPSVRTADNAVSYNNNTTLLIRVLCSINVNIKP